MTTTDNSWVLITGASSGFGEEFARQYAQQGRSLVLVARRSDRLQKLAETLRQQYRIDVVVEQVDLSDVAAILQLHARLRERGIAVDILINNAGHGLQGPFLDRQMDAALAMVQLDIASLTAVTHVFAQDMRKRERGKILSPVYWPTTACKISRSMRLPRPMYCALAKPFIANSSAMASLLRCFAQACRTPDSRRRRNRR